MFLHQGLQLGYERSVPAECQLGFDAVFERGQAHLLEPGGLVLRKGLVGEVGQRLPAPEVERGAQALGGRLRVAPLERFAALASESLEAVGVDLIRTDLECVAAAASDEHAFAERLAKT